MSPHRDLATFLEEPSAGWKRIHGCWCPAMPEVPSPDASLVELVESAFVHPFAIVGSFTNTVTIGSDGGGQDYLVEV